MTHIPVPLASPDKPLYYIITILPQYLAVWCCSCVTCCVTPCSRSVTGLRPSDVTARNRPTIVLVVTCCYSFCQGSRTSMAYIRAAVRYSNYQYLLCSTQVTVRLKLGLPLFVLIRRYCHVFSLYLYINRTVTHTHASYS